MECENFLLIDKFRCNLDPDNRRCKVIHWTECRNLQSEAALNKKDNVASTPASSEVAE